MPNNGKQFWDGVTGRPVERKFGSAEFADKARGLMSYPFDSTKPSTRESRSAISERLGRARTIDGVIEETRKLEKQYPDLGEQIRADAADRIEELDVSLGVNLDSEDAMQTVSNFRSTVENTTRQISAEVTNYQELVDTIAEIDTAIARVADSIENQGSVVPQANLNARRLKLQTENANRIRDAIANPRADKLRDVIAPGMSYDEIATALTNRAKLSELGSSYSKTVESVSAPMSDAERGMFEFLAERSGSTVQDLFESSRVTGDDVRDILTGLQVKSIESVEQSAMLRRQFALGNKAMHGVDDFADEVITFNLGDLNVIASSNTEGLDALFDFVRARITMQRLGVETNQSPVPTDVVLLERFSAQGAVVRPGELTPENVGTRSLMFLSDDAMLGTLTHEMGHSLDNFLEGRGIMSVRSRIQRLSETQPSWYGNKNEAEDFAESYATQFFPVRSGEIHSAREFSNYKGWYDQIPERLSIVREAYAEAWNKANALGHPMRAQLQGTLLAQTREELVALLKKSTDAQVQLGRRLESDLKKLRAAERTATDTSKRSRIQSSIESIRNTFESLGNNTSSRCL
jgi:hypothetical protein